MGDQEKRVAVVIAHNFEDSEALEPIRALTEAGAIAVLIGIDRNMVTGKKGAVLQPDMAFSELAPDAARSFDMLVIPGGSAPENLRIHDPAVAFVRAFSELDRPIASICHGAQLLITADVLRGRRTTCVNKIRDDVTNAGAIYEDAPLVIDGNLISARVPADLPVFNDAIVVAIGLGGKS